MKKLTLLLLALFLSAGSHVYADDITDVLNEVNTIQTTIEDKTPPQVKGFFASLEAWRIKERDRFVILRDEADATLHPTEEDVKPGTITFNEEGNVELHTGISEAKEQPKEAFTLYWYTFVAFIFSTVYLFYAVLILIVLSILKLLFGMLFRRKN